MTMIGEPTQEQARDALEVLARTPHVKPHYRSNCPRCMARQKLSWADHMEPFACEDCGREDGTHGVECFDNWRARRGR